MAFKKVCIDGITYDGKTKMPQSASELNLSVGKQPFVPGHSKKFSTSQLSFKSKWIEGVRESQGHREAREQINKSLSKLPSPTTPTVEVDRDFKRGFSVDSNRRQSRKSTSSGTQTPVQEVAIHVSDVDADENGGFKAD